MGVKVTKGDGQALPLGKSLENERNVNRMLHLAAQVCMLARYSKHFHERIAHLRSPHPAA
jgi:hypothetical protein